MRISNLLESLQKKPPKTRKKVMWIGVFLCSLVIFLFWFFLTPHESNNKNTSSLDFSELKDGVKERVNKSGLNNISGGMKEVTGGLKKQNVEDVIEENEVPRLPLEIE